jgi:hypothetical protein
MGILHVAWGLPTDGRLRAALLDEAGPQAYFKDGGSATSGARLLCNPAGEPMRRLLSTRRYLPLDRADEYLLAWLAVKRAVTDGGGHAWLFRGAAHEDQFLEFIEWDDAAAEPLQDANVLAALAQLGTFAAPTSSEEWEEMS